MHKYIRIIPRLDIKGPNLVKGVNFEGLRVLGKPEEFARHYYEAGADELVYMDVVASLYGRNSLLDIIRKTSSDIFIPLTVSGGLRTVDDIGAALRAGADKVSINTAAIERPELIRDASRKFGSSTIVISVDAKKKSGGIYEAYTNYGRERTAVDAVKWAMQAETLGAGELMVTSIDREGTGRGFDLELIRGISSAVSIPVIAAGGAGSAKDIYEAIAVGGADAVCVSSLLHYSYADSRSYNKRDFAQEGNLEYLSSGSWRNKVREYASIAEIKRYLTDRDIPCRPEYQSV